MLRNWVSKQAVLGELLDDGLIREPILDQLVDVFARRVREPGDLAAARARTHTQQGAAVSADESFLTGNAHTSFSFWSLVTVRRQARRINVPLLYIGGEKSIWSIGREDFLNFFEAGMNSDEPPVDANCL